MGADVSTDKSGQYDQREFKVIRQGNDALNGDYRLLINHKTGKLYTLTKYLCINEVQFERFIQECEFRSQLTETNLCRQFKFRSIDQSDYCGNTWSVEVINEYFENNLKTEIKQRIQSNEHFTEGEIWYALASAASGLHYLQTKSLAHCDIRPETLLITESGYLKILMNPFFNQLLKNYQDATITEHKSEFYLSPELFSFLGQRSMQPSVDLFKSDIFSLGLSLLEMASMENVHVIYDYGKDRYQINMQNLDELLDHVKDKHSKSLRDVLALMLELREADRISYTDLLIMINNQLDHEGLRDIISDYIGHQQKREPVAKPETQQIIPQEPVYIPPIYIPQPPPPSPPPPPPPPIYYTPIIEAPQPIIIIPSPQKGRTDNFIRAAGGLENYLVYGTRYSEPSQLEDSQYSPAKPNDSKYSGNSGPSPQGPRNPYQNPNPNPHPNNFSYNPNPYDSGRKDNEIDEKIRQSFKRSQETEQFLRRIRENQ